MRQTLHRQSLRGLKTVGLKVNLLADGCDGSFFPVVRSVLQKSITDVLTSNALTVVASATPQLVIDVRARLLTFTEVPIVLVKIETALRESVVIARNSLKTDVDTWRHRSIAAVFSGIPDFVQARELIEAEVLRQVDAFASEVPLAGEVDSDSPTDPPVDEPVPPPVSAPTGERKCHRIRLGVLDGVPEFKTVMETQCTGPAWARVCIDVPVIYTRTGKVAAYAEVCGPTSVMDVSKTDIESCAIMAAGAVTIAVIATAPAAALSAFRETFLPCITSKLREQGSQLDVKLKVEQEAGDWHRRT
jgi:hypothetical protein